MKVGLPLGGLLELLMQPLLPLTLKKIIYMY
jgi:hypothetical protein